MAAGFLPFVSAAPPGIGTSTTSARPSPQYHGGVGDNEVYVYDAVELALKAIERVHGDLSDGERRFMAALTTVHVQTPLGTLRLDRNHDEVGPNFLIRVEKDANGKLMPRTVGVVPDVDDSFGGYFTAASPPDSRTQPVCRKGHVPPWAR